MYNMMQNIVHLLAHNVVLHVYHDHSKNLKFLLPDNLILQVII